MAPCLGIPISAIRQVGLGSLVHEGDVVRLLAHTGVVVFGYPRVSWSSNSSFTFKNWRRLQRVEPFRLLLTKQMRAWKNQPTYHLKKWQPFERDWWTYCFLLNNGNYWLSDQKSRRPPTVVVTPVLSGFTARRMFGSEPKRKGALPRKVWWIMINHGRFYQHI